MRLILDGVAFAHERAVRPLFENLTATFTTGGLHAITGPSGSGKSTLLDLIGGLRVPLAGSVSVVERDEESEVPRPITPALCSWVLQSYTVLGRRTVRDNVAIGAILRGIPFGAAGAAALAQLEEFGLADKASRIVNELSGGELQRVTIARCLLEDTPVILADEPTGNLDRANTRMVGEALRAAARRGRIVVVATHDPELEELCDEVLSIREIG